MPATRAAVWVLLGGIVAVSGGAVGPHTVRAQTGPAYLLQSLQNPADRLEARSDILDTPILPGVRLGLPPIPETANLAASLVGLDGLRITPRGLLQIVSRLAGAAPEHPVAIHDAARRVLFEGLRGASQYGSAQGLGARRIAALAKTGTAPMPGGSWMGLVVALEPADAPTRGIVVVVPGAAGLDAAAIAADLLVTRSGSSAPPIRRREDDTGSHRLRQGDGGPPELQRSRKLEAKAEDPPLLERTPETIRVGTTANRRVLRLDLEDYIARVVAAEGEPGAADAAQQALAITARTFALANLQRHRRENYDLCDTTHCQVIRPSTAATRRAAQATAGRVLVHQGQPASVFYSASCGGHSELASAVWPGAIDYAATSQPDDACRKEPRWMSELRAHEIERALRAAGHRGDSLRNLRVIERNASNRVSRLRVEGFSPGEISGHDFRMAVGRVAGWQRMKSTAFDVRRTGAGYQFSGRGFGHGVGLCVIGAGQRAVAGRSADDILRFYFPNLRVDTYRSASRLTAIPDTTAVPAAPPPADPRLSDVLIALPAAEESERRLVVQLIRSARDQIAAKTAVTPPASIRVTVHPTVEAFGRATGQPWWVSGATEGPNIDLLPVTMLRQRGQLERTIRHEMAHVLLDAVLNARSLWVREGAAQYFAESASPAAGSLVVPGLPGRTTCPADAEFLRPLSAGAHRSAYARAEACFRRAIAGGKRWQDIR